MHHPQSAMSHEAMNIRNTPKWWQDLDMQKTDVIATYTKRPWNILEEVADASPEYPMPYSMTKFGVTYRISIRTSCFRQ
jgi:hypothetical protein